MIAAYDLRHRVGSLGGTYTVRCRAAHPGRQRRHRRGRASPSGRLFPSHAGDAVLMARLVAQAGVGTVVYLALARVHRHQGAAAR